MALGWAIFEVLARQDLVRSAEGKNARDQLEYTEDPVKFDDEPYRSSYYEKEELYERALMRLLMAGCRVAVPSGFGGDAKTPKGVRSLYQIQVDSDDGEGLRKLFDGLESVKRPKKRIGVEHEVDDVRARYRILRISGGSGGHGRLHGGIVDGEPVVFDGHRRRAGAYFDKDKQPSVPCMPVVSPPVTMVVRRTICKV